MRYFGAYLVYRILIRSRRGEQWAKQGEPTYGDKALGYFLAVVVFSIPAALFAYAGPIFLAVPFSFIAFLFLYRAVINTIIVIAIRKARK
jgi:hypothetical protein